jgi:phosphatidate cytidylyltransferase
MKNRVITAFLLLFIAIFVIYHGQLPMFLWVLFVGITCAYELIQMAKKNDIKAHSLPIYLIVATAIGSAYLPMTKALWHNPITMGFSLILLGISLVELWQKKLFLAQSNWAMTLRISLFVSLTSSYIYLVRDGQNGILHILFCLLIIWSTDVLALLGGRLFGKTPLSPISPNKTREGSLIGFLGSVIISWIYILVVFIYFDIHMNFLLYTGLAMVVSFVAQIGDLHESLVKRRMQVKDSSNLLPGHGGIYDRADSTLFVMPLVFYLLN